MMYQGFTAADYEASSSRCSSASPAGDSLTYYPSPADSFSSMGSPLNAQDFCTDLAASSANFVPTVTAISTSPDLQWMVQPTLISSVAPSQARTHPYGLQTPQPGPYSRTGMVKGSGSRGQSIGRRGKVEQLTPEEEEKRRIRRERNKMAAAKCRNRRRELTDTLQAETDQLEEEKSALQSEIAHLLKEKEQLEFILAAHRPACKIPGGGGANEAEEEEALSSLAMEDLLPGEGSPPGQEEHHHHPHRQHPPPPPPPGEARAGGEGPALEALEEEEEDAFALPLLHQEPPPLSSSSSSSSLKAEPLEALFPLPSSSSLPGLRRVPDVDLSGGSSSSFYAADWEPLGPAASSSSSSSSGVLGLAPEMEPLCTPVVACTPSFPYTSSAFVFTFPAPAAAENEASSSSAFPTCAAAHRKGSTSNEPSSDSLSSPTLLAL